MPVLLRVQHAHKHHTNYHILSLDLEGLIPGTFKVVVVVVTTFEIQSPHQAVPYRGRFSFPFLKTEKENVKNAPKLRPYGETFSFSETHKNVKNLNVTFLKSKTSC